MKSHYLISAGILSLGSFFIFNALPTAESLSSVFQVQNAASSCKIKQIKSKLTLSSSLGESSYESVDNLKVLCHTCAVESLKLSNKTEQMKWVDESHLRRIRKSLDETCFLTASTFGSFLLSSPFPARSVVFYGDNFVLSLLTIPCGVEVTLPRSDRESLLLYKPLRGFGELKSFNDQIKFETLIMNGNDNFNTKKSDVIIKHGGVDRKFHSQENGPGPSVLLELAFTRGQQSDSTGSMAASDGDISPEQSFTLIQPPILELNELFESAHENENRNNEMIRRNALFSANAKKYDILERIRFRVGGLSSELGDLVRRVLSSRQISSSILRKLGISHIKGILLYGPPGTGKTLIAREMAKALNSREPILINGPEIMDKYVGEAERNIRDLFKPAEEEWATRGAESELHVIIFDEFDSVAKKRGSLSGDGSGVRDSCVNQLLSKLDGVEEMNNVLVICLTNRKDLIDSALLRPGRLEVHIEIKPPQLEGREEILYILFKPMVLGGYVSFEDAKKWSKLLAERTFGYTGADLTGLVRNAASFAIERSLSQIQNLDLIDSKKLSDAEQQIEKTKSRISLEKSIFLLWEDIEKAFTETAKDLKISKRAKIADFISRKLFRSKKSRMEEKKIVRREFEEILNSVDYEAEDLIKSEIEEENQPEKTAVSFKPAFQNIGGTLIF